MSFRFFFHSGFHGVVLFVIVSYKKWFKMLNIILDIKFNKITNCIHIQYIANKVSKNRTSQTGPRKELGNSCVEFLW